MDNKGNRSRRRSRKGRKALIVILIILSIFVIFYLLLPSIVLNYSNKKLKSMKEYYGHIEEIEIRLFKGLYSVNGMYLNLIDTTNNDTIPLLKISSVDMKVDWSTLFKGKILANVVVDKPELIFVNKKEVKEKVKEADTLSVKEMLASLIPFNINQFEILNGKIKYTDQNIEPALILEVDKLHVLAKDLSNVQKKDSLLPSSLNASAIVYEGTFETQANFNLMKEQPTFDLKMNLQNVNLVLLNDFIREYGKFDLKQGKFSIFAEFAAKSGAYEGYVKPFIKDFEVKQNDKEEGFLKKAWEKVVDVSMDILENKKSDNVASNIPVSGNFENNNVSVWEAISQVLVNAFIEALKPTFENNINIKDVTIPGKEEKKEKQN